MTDKIKPLIGLADFDIDIRKKILADALRSGPDTEIMQIQNDIQNAKKVIEELKEQESFRDNELIQKLKQYLDSANQASKTITTEAELPPPEDMRIRLVPAHWLTNLEQHRFDGSMAKLCAGIFGGGLFGMVGSWFMGGQFQLNPSMIIVAVIVGFLTFISIMGILVYNNRAKLVLKKMINFKPRSLPKKEENNPSENKKK